MKITSFRAIIHLKNKKEALIFENIISYQFITNAPFLYIQHKGSFKPDKSQGYYLERKRWFPVDNIKKLLVEEIVKFETKKDKEEFKKNKRNT